eukprot:Lithocolla_globosa_v1_NODE_199_length_5224_cov_8.409618.p1 type:complete len:831 gc:universal NODE_199_length_5224_cov_8.409618:2533-41(-)
MPKHTKKHENRPYSPFQIGCGTQGAAQLPANTTQLVLESDSTKVVGKLDAKNGYGTIKRTAIREGLIHSELHSSVPFFDNKYSHSVFLRVPMSDGSVRWIKMVDGIVQGDEDGTFEFSIGFHKTLVETQKTSKDLVVMAYVDDPILLGSPSDVIAGAQTLISESKKVGLDTSGKMASYSPSPNSRETFRRLANNAKLRMPINAEGITLVGCPVGTDSKCIDALTHMARDVEKSLNRLKRLDNKQAELFILRMAISAMPTHLCRSIRPTLAKPTMQHIDTAVLKTTERIINTKAPLPPNAVQRLRLRIANTGLGLTSKEETCNAAYVSGWADSLKIMFDHFPQTKAACKEVLQSENTITKALNETLAQLPEGEKIPKNIKDLLKAPRKLQKQITEEMEKQRFQTFFDAQSPYDQSHILSCKGPAATAFLSAISSRRCFTLTNTEFEISLKRLLALPLDLNLAGASFCSCANLREATDYHLETCSKCGNLITRHDQLRDEVIEMFRKAGIPAQREPRCLPGFGKGGGDILIETNDDYLQNSILDISVIHVQQAKYVHGASKNPLHVARIGERKKELQYADKCRMIRRTFIPLIIESGGALGKKIQKTIAVVRSRVDDEPPERTTWAASTFTKYWAQRLSVTFQRETANSLTRLSRHIRSKQAGFTPPDWTPTSPTFTQSPTNNGPLAGPDETQLEREIRATVEAEADQTLWEEQENWLTPDLEKNQKGNEEEDTEEMQEDKTEDEQEEETTCLLRGIEGKIESRMGWETGREGGEERAKEKQQSKGGQRIERRMGWKSRREGGTERKMGEKKRRAHATDFFSQPRSQESEEW